MPKQGRNQRLTTTDDGIVLAYKPPGLSSARLVSKLKRLTNGKVGHTGTLDRFAEGLMILLVGRATVFSDFFLKLDKSYLATLRFGVSTNTIDPNGDIIEEWPESKLALFLENNQVEITKAIQNRVNQTQQIPPEFAAIKQGGIRLSDRSRKGLPIEVRHRTVRFYESYRILDELAISKQASVKAFFSVSSGTYIRSAVRDIGQELVVPVHLERLCRQSVGRFSVDNSTVWRDFEQKPQIMPLLSVFYDWPKQLVSKHAEGLVRNGVKISLDKQSYATGTNLFFVTECGELLAWCQLTEQGYTYKKIFT